MVLEAILSRRRVAVLVWCLLIVSSRRSDALQMIPYTQQHVAKKASLAKEGLDPRVFAMNKMLINGVKGGIDIIYKDKDIERFYTLETVARVPYFAFCSALHLRETFGDRSGSDRLRLHYAQQDNEYHHLCIMEALLGDDTKTIDRLIAQVMACGFYWYCALTYLLAPRAAIHLSELIESHAYSTYSDFLDRNGEKLKALPVPAVAHEYYSADPKLFEFFWSFGSARKPPVPLHSLYDVFLNIRDDELGHWATLTSLIQFDQTHLPHGHEPTPTIPFDTSTQSLPPPPPH